MRGTPDPELATLTTVSTEDLISVDHPIRKIRVVVDAVLAELDPIFDEMYATSGRRSVPPGDSGGFVHRSGRHAQGVLPWEVRGQAGTQTPRALSHGAFGSQNTLTN